LFFKKEANLGRRVSMGREVSINTVMLLNSHDEVLELNHLLLSSKGRFNTFFAKNIDDFLTIISKVEIDCFILDWNFENYSILDLAEKIRKSIKYGNKPIIFLTDKKDTHLPFQYSALKVDQVIHRPLVLQEFEHPLLEICEKKLKKIIPENFNVLILDNNQSILDIMKGHMEEISHSLYQTCKSIAEAKTTINKEEFDLFLLDWNLDDGTCLDLIEFIRSKTESMRLKESLIMVITGRDDVEDIMTLLQFNVLDHIIKPFTYFEFEEKVIYALERQNKKILKGFST